MEIDRPDRKTLVLSELDLFLVELLRQIPVSADPQESGAALNRIFSNPADPAKDPDACAEWKIYVQPELRHIFDSANKTVGRDLKRFEETKTGGETHYALRVPVSHLDAWLNSLNQARLSLAARFDFTEKELEAHSPDNLESVRDLSLLQIHFYGFLQEVFLRQMRG